MSVELLSELEASLAQIGRVEEGAEPARALEEYERALPVLERAGDEGRIQLVRTLTSIAALHDALGHPDDAHAAADRATALIAEYALHPDRFGPPRRQGVAPPHATDVALELATNVAIALASATDTERLRVFDALAEQTAAKPAMALALLLQRAALEMRYGTPSAPAAFDRAWQAAMAMVPPDAPQLDQWVPLAELALALGRNTEALAVAHRLRAVETTPDHDDEVLECLYQARRIEASVTVNGTDAAATERALNDLLEFSRGAFGQGNDHTIGAESSLGNFLTRAGRPSEALDLLRHVANARTTSPSYPDPPAASAVFDLAWALDTADQDTEAMTYYVIAYHLYRRTLGPTHPRAVESAMDLAETARIAHDYETAERWFGTALEAERAGAGQRTARAAHILNNLAQTLLAAGRAVEAAPLADEALQIRVEMFGERSDEYHRSLGVVAEIALARRDRSRVDEVIATSQRLSGSKSVSLPVTASMDYLELVGDIDQAIAIGRAGIESGEHAHGDSLVPGQATSLRFALGALCARASRWSEAKEALFEAFRDESTVLSDEAGLRSARQLRTMFAESRSRIGILLDVLAQDTERSPEDIRQAYTIVQQRRGLETRLMRLQKLSYITDRALTSVPQERLDAIKKEVADIVGELQRARQDWLAALIREAEHVEPPPDSLSVVGYQDRVELRERELAGYVGQGSRDFELLGVGSSVPRVDAGQAVVEYVYADTPTPTWYAFVVTHDGLQFVPLGEAGQIQQALLQLRTEIVDGAPEPGDPDPAWRRRARFLANRLLKPLLRWLEGTGQLYVVPDAELFTLPFDLLPLEDGRLAIDRWVITHLWNGGELARFNVTLGNPPSPESPVVLSAPACADGAGNDTWHFAALPFADSEGTTLTEKLGAVHLSGPGATKAAVAKLADAEILHFATHSFYISVLEPGAPASDATPLLYRARSLLADPMLRSGIALSGADSELGAPTAASPGILFASEVLDLDLRNTDLAVLSSCQSGLGDPRPGDGIHGLRRAFRAAGCNSVVSSLWKVPDEATSEFMVDFYDRLLAQTPRGRALRDAKLAMRGRHPDDPLFWAGFVLDGSDRPLFRFSGMQGLRIANVSGVALSYILAHEQIKREEWSEAQEQLECVLNSRTASDELRADAATSLARLFRQTGRLQEAMALWDQIIANARTPDENRSAAVVDRAVTRQLTGDLEGAYLDYASALRSAGTSAVKRAWILVNRGVLFVQQGKLDAAIANWTEVIANPDSPPDQKWKALLNRADAYRQMERYDEAVSDTTTLVDAPESKGSSARAKAYLVMAQCRAELGDLPGAIAAVRQHLRECTPPAPLRRLREVTACTSAQQLKALIATLM